MTVIAVRPLEARDLGAVVEMIAALAEHHGDAPRVSEAALARDALGADPWIAVRVAESGGRLLGYMALKRLAWLHYGDRGLEIYHLYVRPGARGRGVARTLIEAAKAIARADGCTELKVGTHPDNGAASDYYLAHGFSEQPLVGRRFRLLL